MLRILANENISATVIQGLRQQGHDVLSVKESLRGARDSDILARAQAEERLVLTNDKDFGELAFRFGFPAKAGVVLLRLAGRNAASDNERALQALQSYDDWTGHFSVVTDDRVRMRPLPATPPNPPNADS